MKPLFSIPRVPAALLVVATWLLAGCLDSGDAPPAASDALPAGVPVTVSGVAYAKAPLAGATVTVKDRYGRSVGTAVTDSAGAYSVKGTGAEPLVARVTDKAGSTLYGIGWSGVLNVTPPGNALLSLWAEAEATTVEKVFNALAADTALPNVYELEAAVEQLLTDVEQAAGVGSIDLLRETSAARLAAVLASTSISADQKTIRFQVDNGFAAEIRLAAALDSHGAVRFSGQATVTPAGGIPPGADSATFTARVATSVRPLGAYPPNHAWMDEMRDVIGPRRLADVTLPGTHDSGTAGIMNVLVPISRTAETQTRSIGEQLNDGIRYFDLRVREGAHWGCADPSVFWLNHGSLPLGAYHFDGARVQDALREIKAFVSDPAHAREIIVLDFQGIQLGYDDARAAAVLFTTIQNQLGDYLIDNHDANYRWQGLPKDKSTTPAKTLQDIWAANAANGKKKQIIALLPGGWITNPPSGCGSNWNTKYFWSRDVYVNSYYGERPDPGPLMDDIEVQLSEKAASSRGRSDLFDTYRVQQEAGRLNVLQIVSRPHDEWYLAMLTNSYIDTLLEYGNRINRAFNANWSCEHAWFGKRLWMGYNPEQTYNGRWNRGNIVIVDWYSGFDGWITATWTGSGWRKTSGGGYVDFIRRINQNPDPVASGAGSVTSFQDDQCLN